MSSYMQSPPGSNDRSRNRDHKPGSKPAVKPLPPAKARGMAQLLADEDDAAAALERERKEDLSRGKLARAILGRRSGPRKTAAARIVKDYSNTREGGVAASDDWE